MSAERISSLFREIRLVGLENGLVASPEDIEIISKLIAQETIQGENLSDLILKHYRELGYVPFPLETAPKWSDLIPSATDTFRDECQEMVRSEILGGAKICSIGDRTRLMEGIIEKVRKNRGTN